MTIEGLQAAKLAAREAGEITFTIGIPCRRGHISPRYASTGACITCLTGKVYGGGIHASLRGLIKPYVFSAKLSSALSDYDTDMLETYLTICVNAYCKAKGVESYCDTGAANWSQETGRPMKECPGR
jgi:hypothetical protein